MTTRATPPDPPTPRGRLPFSARPVRWLEGDPAIHAATDCLLAGGEGAFERLSKNPRREVAAARLPSVPDRDAALAVVLKTHRLATGRHRVRERIKCALGRSPARREWRALGALAAAGVPVPRALAYGRLASGDELLVLARIPGRPLAEALLAADEAARRRLVALLAATLTRLWASGHVHGDLQLGNLWLAAPDGAEDDEGAVHLLDLQRARRDRSARQADAGPTRARLRDLARLELSLLRMRLPAAVRLELRAALGVGRAADAALRRFAADHLRGRVRRVVRRGRGLAAIGEARFRGERDASLAEAAVLEAVVAAANDPARRLRRGGRAWIAEATLEGREVVVKWTAAAGLGERIVARWRGSRARRAFDRGRREQLLLARSARPLAWLEERGELRSTGASWLVLEKVGEADLDTHRPSDPTAARALALCVAEGLAALHAVGVAHTDLKGSNLRIGRRRDAGAADPSREVYDFWLVDLEDLVLPVQPSDDARLTAWSQLNASLPDAHFDCAVREAALARALALLPFEDEALDFDAARREIVRRALARHHRWRGVDAADSETVGTEATEGEEGDEGRRGRR